IHVNAAPQRNQKSARGISSGTTFFFVSASIVGTNAELTQLKKYRRPIQRIPKNTWSQRNNDSIKFITSIRSLLPPERAGAYEPLPSLSRNLVRASRWRVDRPCGKRQMSTRAGEVAEWSKAHAC